MASSRRSFWRLSVSAERTFSFLMRSILRVVLYVFRSVFMIIKLPPSCVVINKNILTLSTQVGM